MLRFFSIYPFPLVAPVMFRVTKAGQEVENDGQSIPYTAWFFKCHFSTSERYIPGDSPVPLDPNAFTHQVSSSVSFPPCGPAWCKAASFKGGLSKVTFSWKHTIAHSVSTRDMIVIQLTVVSVLLVWGRKLLFSQLSSLFKSESSINSLSESFFHWCFDDVFSNRVWSWPCITIIICMEWKETRDSWMADNSGSCYSNAFRMISREGDVIYYLQTLNWPNGGLSELQKFPVWLN